MAKLIQVATLINHIQITIETTKITTNPHKLFDQHPILSYDRSRPERVQLSLALRQKEGFSDESPGVSAICHLAKNGANCWNIGKKTGKPWFYMVLLLVFFQCFFPGVSLWIVVDLSNTWHTHMGHLDQNTFIFPIPLLLNTSQTLWSTKILHSTSCVVRIPKNHSAHNEVPQVSIRRARILET